MSSWFLKYNFAFKIVNKVVHGCWWYFMYTCICIRKTTAFRNMSNTTSPNSSTSGTSGTSGSSSVTPIRSSRGKSTSSKGSTTSTLTPSPSPTPGKVPFSVSLFQMSWFDKAALCYNKYELLDILFSWNMLI